MSKSKSSSEYIPGVCNIGAVETANRRKIGIGGATVTIALWVMGLALDVPSFLYVILALPAFVGATGLMQAQQHFCAGFGAEGLYNFGDTLGNYKQATKKEDRALDKKKAVSITVQSGLIGALVAAIAVTTSVLI